MYSTGISDVMAVMIEAEEQLEAVTPEGQPEILVATAGTELLDEAAAVLAFALNVSFGRNQRSLSGLVSSPSVGGGLGRASNVLARTFDPAVVLKQEDFEGANNLLKQLVALNRRYYEAAIRAIRRVVDATYLVAEDPTTAYTMYVAALESLAQVAEFPLEHDWHQYDSAKKKIIDDAVAGLDEDAAERVRQAVLTVDKLSLRRRFISFVLGHVRPSFYRHETSEAIRPPRAVDLPKGLDLAYQMRSKDVHVLEKVVPELWVVADRAESIPIRDSEALGLEALNRLSRHVIRTFIEGSPTSLDTSFDYRDHLPGILKVRLAPQLWIGQPAALNRDNASDILAGYLQLLLPAMAGRDDAELVDMGRTLKRVEDLLKGENNRAVRRPMVALYILWHGFMERGLHRPSAAQFIERYSGDLDDPSVDGFVVRVLFGQAIEWSSANLIDLVHERERELRRQPTRDFPQRLDAALCLAGAQHVWNEDRQLATALLGKAVEMVPGDLRLIALEEAGGKELPGVDLRSFVAQTGTWSDGNIDE